MKNQITHRFEGSSCGDSLQNVLNHNGTAFMVAIPEGIDKKEAMFAPLLLMTRETLIIDGNNRDVVAIWRPRTYLEAQEVTLVRYNEPVPNFEAWWLPGRYGFSKTNVASRVDFLDQKHYFLRANSPSENVWLAMRYYFWETQFTDFPKENTKQELMKYYEENHDEWLYSISSIFRNKRIIYPMSIDAMTAFRLSLGGDE